MKKSRGFTVEDHKELAPIVIALTTTKIFDEIEECFPKTSVVAKQSAKVLKEIESLRSLLDEDLFKIMRNSLKEGKNGWDQKKMIELNKIYYPER